MAAKIEPSYVTFEQAKLLKDKGFDVPVRYGVFGRKMKLTQYVGSHRNPCQVDRNWNNAKAKSLSAPEQWQVVEWLRVNHGIWLCVAVGINGYDAHYSINHIGKVSSSVIMDWVKKGAYTSFDTPQEAYSAAFDYILQNLI